MGLLNRFTGVFRRNRLERDLDEELQFHIGLKTQENIAAGMSPEEARYAAIRAFGGVEQKKEECRDADHLRWLEDVIQDVRYGLRQLRRNPGFTAVAVLTLALGIGANTAIFSLIDAVLLKTLPVRNPQRLILLHWTSRAHSDAIMNNITGDVSRDMSGGWESTSFPYPMYRQIRASNTGLSSVAALAANGSELNVVYKGQPSRANGELVSGSFFHTLGVEAQRGRVLTPQDDHTGVTPVAVISHGYWEGRFGSDPAIIGETITINSVPFTIVGVSQPRFYGIRPGRRVQIWLPLHTEAQVERLWGPLLDAPDSWWALIVGRLKPGVTEEQARANLEVILQQSIAPAVKPNTAQEVIPHLALESASKGLNTLRSEFSKPLWIMMAIVGLVLLIACANVANLMLARATTRHKEIAVRIAVGGGRRRLLQQLLTESVLLAGLGGVMGLLFAFWIVNLLLSFLASGREPLVLTVTPDLRVLVFTAAATVLTGILFGLSPALRSTRVELASTLKESPGGALAETGRRGLRLDRVLVITQVSLSLVLLIGAIQFVRTLTNLEQVNLGFNQHHLLLFGIDPTQDGYKGKRVVDFYQELAQRIAGLPGVRSVGLSENTLIGGGSSFLGTRIEGYKPKSGETGGKVGALYNWVGPTFFATMEIPLIVGRVLKESDTQGEPSVAVVNEEFARQFLEGDNPVGRLFSVGHQRNIQVVGVVGDAKFYSLKKKAQPTVYLPYLQYVGELNPMHFEVRTSGSPLDIVNSVRRVAQNMNPRLAIYDVRSQTEQINQTIFQERLFARLTGFFGLIAALLASVGIYGVVAFTVTRRTREIGIRMAMGATCGKVAGEILAETCAWVGIGIGVGVVVALGVSKLVGSMFYGLQPNDPLSLFLAAALMLIAAGLATYIPARRAAKVDPMVALRYE